MIAQSLFGNVHMYCANCHVSPNFYFLYAASFFSFLVQNSYEVNRFGKHSKFYSLISTDIFSVSINFLLWHEVSKNHSRILRKFINFNSKFDEFQKPYLTLVEGKLLSLNYRQKCMHKNCRFIEKLKLSLKVQFIFSDKVTSDK